MDTPDKPGQAVHAGSLHQGIQKVQIGVKDWNVSAVLAVSRGWQWEAVV